MHLGLRVRHLWQWDICSESSNPQTNIFISLCKLHKCLPAGGTLCRLDVGARFAGEKDVWNIKEINYQDDLERLKNNLRRNFNLKSSLFLGFFQKGWGVCVDLLRLTAAFTFKWKYRHIGLTKTIYLCPEKKKKILLRPICGDTTYSLWK